MKQSVSVFLMLKRIEKNILSILNTGGKNLKQSSFMPLFFKEHFLRVSFFSAFQNFKKNILFARIFSLFFNMYLNKVKAIDKSIFYNIKKLLNYKKNNIVLNLKKLILRRFPHALKTKKLFFITKKNKKQNTPSFSALKPFKLAIDLFKIQNIKKHIKSKALTKNQTVQNKIKTFNLIIFKNQKKSIHIPDLIAKKTSSKELQRFLSLIKLACKRNYLIMKNKIRTTYNFMNLKHYLKSKNSFFFKHKSKIGLYKIKNSKKAKVTLFNPLLSLQKPFTKKNSHQKTIWLKKMLTSISNDTKIAYQFFNKNHYNKLILNRFYQIFKKFTSFFTKIKSNNQFKIQHYRSKQTKLNSRKEKLNDRNIYGYCCS